MKFRYHPIALLRKMRQFRFQFLYSSLLAALNTIDIFFRPKERNHPVNHKI